MHPGSALEFNSRAFFLLRRGLVSREWNKGDTEKFSGHHQLVLTAPGQAGKINYRLSSSLSPHSLLTFNPIPLLIFTRNDIW